MIHSAVNFQGCGLPFELKQQIAAEVWGDASAIDPDKNYTPMNEYKANFACGPSSLTCCTTRSRCATGYGP